MSCPKVAGEIFHQEFVDDSGAAFAHGAGQCDTSRGVTQGGSPSPGECISMK